MYNYSRGFPNRLAIDHLGMWWTAQRGSLNVTLEGMISQCQLCFYLVRKIHASTKHTGIPRRTTPASRLRGFHQISTLGKMATSTDAQQPVAKPVVHPSSSPAKTERQILDGRDSPHPTDTSVIRATAAATTSSTPRGQNPLTLVSATAGSSSRTASPITHLEEARGERVSLSHTGKRFSLLRRK